MVKRLLALVITGCVLAGCATAPPPAESSVPWLDREFAWDPARVTVSRDDLFRLDADLESKLVESGWREAPIGQRLKRLLVAIYGTDGKAFAYRAGHSTVAAETWHNRSGDCLSLTVLAYSAIRKLNIKPVMQEVQTPVVYGRAGELDLVNQHVNVLLPNLRTDLTDLMARDFVLDFEPDYNAPFRGVPLTEDGIVARYYNNVAVEAMAQGDHPRAYAYFKAAAKAEPGYFSTYSNLAVLYRRIGRDHEAESLLRLALGGTSDVALHELHRLLEDQHRTAEAQAVERQLASKRWVDPYHWMSLGLTHLVANDTRHAIDEFERARDLAPTFPEVHRYLALAYARSGDTHKAREEVGLMETSGGSLNKIAMLRRKLDRIEQRTQ